MPRGLIPHTGSRCAQPDRFGDLDLAWHEWFLSRVHEAALTEDSRAAVTVEIYASPNGAWHIGGDSLIGSGRFLLGDNRLICRPVGSPAMFAVGVRRPSGRVHGLLNLTSPPSLAASHALNISPAASLNVLPLPSPSAVSPRRLPQRLRHHQQSLHAAHLGEGWLHGSMGWIIGGVAQFLAFWLDLRVGERNGERKT